MKIRVLILSTFILAICSRCAYSQMYLEKVVEPLFILDTSLLKDNQIASIVITEYFEKRNWKKKIKRPEHRYHLHLLEGQLQYMVCYYAPEIDSVAETISYDTHNYKSQKHYTRLQNVDLNTESLKEILDTCWNLDISNRNNNGSPDMHLSGQVDPHGGPRIFIEEYYYDSLSRLNKINYSGGRIIKDLEQDKLKLDTGIFSVALITYSEDSKPKEILYDEDRKRKYQYTYNDTGLCTQIIGFIENKIDYKVVFEYRVKE